MVQSESIDMVPALAVKSQEKGKATKNPTRAKNILKTTRNRVRKKPDRFAPDNEIELLSDDYNESEHDSDYNYEMSDDESNESVASIKSTASDMVGGVGLSMDALNIEDSASDSGSESDSLYETMVKNDNEDESYVPSSDDNSSSDDDDELMVSNVNANANASDEDESDAASTDDDE